MDVVLQVVSGIGPAGLSPELFSRTTFNAVGPKGAAGEFAALLDPHFDVVTVCTGLLHGA